MKLKNKRQPLDMSSRDWKRALQETKSALGNKDLSVLAAGVAYFSTLAFFPALAAFVSIYALFATPEQIVGVGQSAKHIMPSAMADFITGQLVPLAHDSKKSLIGGILAILIALFGASSAVQNLIKALNRTFEVEERRKGIKLRLISLIFMAGLILAAFPITALILVNPHLLILDILRWLALAIIVTLVLASIYRYAPDRREPRWQIVSWGGAGATLIWLLGTALFFIYIQHFSSFNKTYGVFAGIIILMSWLNLSAFIILIGAEVNHHIEEEVEPSQKIKKWNPLRFLARNKA